MKLQVRTLDRQIFNVTFSQFRTVGELKEYVCQMCRDPIRPETQQIVYAGHALNDNSLLKNCCIDERRFLLLTDRKPKEPVSIDRKEENPKTNSCEAVASVISINKPIIKFSEWPKEDVRRALLISLNDRDRALDCLRNGNIFFPKMITPPSSDHSLHKTKKKVSFMEYPKHQVELTPPESGQSSDEINMLTKTFKRNR